VIFPIVPALVMAVLLGFLIFVIPDHEIGIGSWCRWISRHRYAVLVCSLLFVSGFAILLWLLRQHELAQVNCTYSYFGCEVRPPHPTTSRCQSEAL
jgi:hypothetical protein